MPSFTITAQPAAAAVTLLQPYSLRRFQPQWPYIGAESPRLWMAMAMEKLTMHTCDRNFEAVPAAPRRLMATDRLSITSALGSQNLEGVPAVPPKLSFPILVNSCTGKMGRAVAEAAVRAGLQLVPVSFSPMEVPDGKVEICGREIHIHDPSESEQILPSIIKDYPNVIVVDYTVPDAVNANAELYCKMGLPFVMGTTGGDRQLLHKTVQDTNNYAVISRQMAKQVSVFLAFVQTMAEQFPGAFSGFGLEVTDSHQATKSDISGTAKAVISCFRKLGVPFDLVEVKKVRDPQEQVALGVPEEHLSGHAFHRYHLTSPDGRASSAFEHKVLGRSIYAEGTVDATMFLYTKIKSGASQKLYNMIDVSREGNMR